MWQNQNQDKALLSEITEEDLEAIRQREEAIQQIEVSHFSHHGLLRWKWRFLVVCAQHDRRNGDLQCFQYSITGNGRDYQAFLNMEISGRRKN